MAPMMMNSTFQPRGMHPPVSNTERQRLFRQRHPTYNRDYKRRQRALIDAAIAATAAARAQARLATPAPAPGVTPAPGIPAPGIPEGVWITLPVRELVPVPVEAAQPEAAQPMVIRVIEG